MGFGVGDKLCCINVRLDVFRGGSELGYFWEAIGAELSDRCFR